MTEEFENTSHLPEVAVAPRRRFLRLMGAATAAAGASAVLARPAPVAAASGNMIYGGSNNAGTDVTTLFATSTEKVLVVTQFGTASGNGETAALDANQMNKDPAIRATNFSGQAGSIGLYGRVSGATDGVALDALANGLGSRGVRSEALGANSVGVSGSGEAYGIDGNSPVGTGVRGRGSICLDALNTSSSSAIGVRSQVPLGVGADIEARTPLRIRNDGRFDPRTDVISHVAGDMVVDASGTWWVCVAAGTPGVWRRLASENSAGAMTFLPTPVRVYDSRPGQQPLVGVKSPLVIGNGARRVDCTTGGHVPPTARGVLVNLTVTNTVGSGYVRLWPAAATEPTTSSINWTAAGTVVANTTAVGLGDAGKVDCLAGGPSGSANIVLDVIAYWL